MHLEWYRCIVYVWLLAAGPTKTRRLDAFCFTTSPTSSGYLLTHCIRLLFLWPWWESYRLSVYLPLDGLNSDSFFNHHISIGCGALNECASFYDQSHIKLDQQARKYRKMCENLGSEGVCHTSLEIISFIRKCCKCLNFGNGLEERVILGW